jgi:hypothetical protein
VTQLKFGNGRFKKDTVKDIGYEKGRLMSRTGNLLVLLLLFVLLCIVPIAKNVVSQDKHEEFWQFVQTVQDILAGKNVEQAQTIIPRGARLIYGARVENLKGVVTGEIKTCSLADTSYHQVEIIAQTNPSEDAGFLMLKTVKYDTTKVRFHTIVFMKDSTGQYKISIWQAGD